MPFAADYVILVFASSFGVIQIAAAYRALTGLLPFKNTYINYFSGAIFILVSFIWFFCSEYRNISDTEGGLDGNQQAGLFVISSASALLFTILYTSIIHRNFGKNITTGIQGLESLKDSSYYWSIKSTLANLWKR